MTIIDSFIEIAWGWLRDLALSILGRHAEAFVAKMIRRTKGKRNHPERSDKRKRDN